MEIDSILKLQEFRLHSSIIKFSYFIIFLLIIQSIIFPVNLCPVEKNPTQIKIEHSRHPINIPLGITSNSIDVTIQLTAFDRKTEKSIPLVNKEVLIELTIGGKFIVKDSAGNFILSDTSSPFPLNTSENGTISFTVYTQPPLLNESIDPRKISYSITASFVPKPKEPLMGSVKTERYVPGVFPIISMAACAPLFIIFALLIAAMFASGKNPFGLFDFSRIAFRVGGIPQGRVTTRAKTTLVGVAATAASATLKEAAKIGILKARKWIVKKTEPSEEQKKKTGIIMKGLQLIIKTPGRILTTAISRPLSKEERKRIAKMEQKAATGALSKKEAEELAKLKGRIITGPFGWTRIVTAGEDFRGLGRTSLMVLGQVFAQLGTKPWSLVYAQIPEIQRPNRVLTKEEREELKKNVENTYDITLGNGDIGIYGLTKKIKEEIAKRFDLLKSETEEIEILSQIKNGKIPDNLEEKLRLLQTKLDEKLNDKQLTDGEKSIIKTVISQISQIKNGKMLSESPELKNNIEKVYQLYQRKLNNILAGINERGALIGFDKEKIIASGELNGKAYYANYGLDEFKAKVSSQDMQLLANAVGLPLDRIVEAFENKDYNELHKIFEKVKDDPNSLLVFNFITKEVMVGHVMQFLDKIELKDQNGKLISDPIEKTYAFLKGDYNSISGKETLTRAVIDTMLDELTKNKDLERAVKIVKGEGTKLDPDTILFTVMKGRDEIQDKINKTKSELKEIEERYRSASGDEALKLKDEVEAMKRKLINEEINLQIVEKGISEIVNNREILKLTKDVYDAGIQLEKNIHPGIKDVVAPTPEAIYNMKKIAEASGILNAATTAFGVMKAVDNASAEIHGYGYYMKGGPAHPGIDKLVEEGISKRIPQQQTTEIDKTIEYIGSLVLIYVENYEPITAVGEFNVYDAADKALPTLMSMQKIIKEGINKIEDLQKREGIITDEEKRKRYDSYLDTLKEVNDRIKTAREGIKKSIDEYRKENMTNPLGDKIARLSFKYNDNGKITDPAALIDVLKDKKEEKAGEKKEGLTYPYGAIYYYAEGVGGFKDDKIKEEIKTNYESEKKDWNKKFFEGGKKPDTSNENKQNKK